MPKQEQRDGEGPGIVSSYSDIWVTSYSKMCKWSLPRCQWQSCYHLWHTHFHHPISIHYDIILVCSILSSSPILVFPPYFFLLSLSDQSRWILLVYCLKNKAKIINHTDGWTRQCFIYSTILTQEMLEQSGAEDFRGSQLLLTLWSKAMDPLYPWHQRQR